MQLSDADQSRITAAVTAAEATTDAEIVPIVAAHSDAYHDVVLHWAILAMLVVMAAAAIHPDGLIALRTALDGGWATPPPPGDLITLLLFGVAAIVLIIRLLVGLPALRYRLTPGATKARRVRHRAVDLFHVGVQAHTGTRTGVLLYLSLAERRAEIVADRAVHAAVPPEAWGDILGALLVAVRAGHTADGMVAAIGAIGETLAHHFPHSGGDAPELPDRLIQI
ncbi:MAG TPA: TPM domain-containing protein [Sphingomonas sp.]|jgi:putative membrane protein|uniref:TPM domain-containing protein n=1 Tax=Sphingomonas sp. TaxID=28214 RepID=UPI002ED9E437